MIAKLFEMLTTIVTGTLGLLVDSIEGVTSIFYTEETGFTFVGTLMLLGFGMSLAYFGWKVIKGLLKR